MRFKHLIALVRREKPVVPVSDASILMMDRNSENRQRLALQLLMLDQGPNTSMPSPDEVFGAQTLPVADANVVLSAEEMEKQRVAQALLMLDQGPITSMPSPNEVLELKNGVNVVIAENDEQQLAQQLMMLEQGPGLYVPCVVDDEPETPTFRR